MPHIPDVIFGIGKETELRWNWKMAKKWTKNYI